MSRKASGTVRMVCVATAGGERGRLDSCCARRGRFAVSYR